MFVRSVALKSEGAAGPSGADAADWRRFCSSFHGASAALCESIAALARRLCTSFLDPSGFSAFLVCRLIALDKSPGVRPIGIGEVCRRIIGKSILKIIGLDIQEAAGSLQLCAGQHAGCEAAVHSLRNIFSESDTQAVLFVDAANAFNNLNCQVALLC